MSWARFYAEDHDLEAWRMRQLDNDRDQLSRRNIEVFTALAQNPVDINRAGTRRLYELPRISWHQAQAIVAHRRQHGPFRRVEDLLAIAGIDAELLWLLRPFLRAGMPLDGRLAYRRWQLHDQAGYSGQDYLRWRLRRGSDEHGGLLTRRPLAPAAYDPSRGRLQSPGERTQPRLDALYYARRTAHSGFVIGSFVAGFGERLVFDVTRRSQPRGVYTDLMMDEDPARGQLRPGRSLAGLALEWRPLPWWGVVFAAQRRRSVYQYDIRYGPDAAQVLLLADCQRPGQRRQGFVCGEDGRWYTSQVVITHPPGGEGRYLNLAEAMNETVLGTHLGYQSGLHHWGMTAYLGRVEPRLNAPAVRFAPAARYPAGRPHLYAVGVSHEGRSGPWLWGSELAVTQGAGRAGLLRLVRESGPGQEWTLLLRYYGPDYVNPFARGSAAPDEEQGLRQRNERGARLQWRWSRNRWQWMAEVDAWENPYRWLAAQQRWQRRPQALRHIAVYQRGKLELTAQESLALSFGYTRKNLARRIWGRDETDGPGARGRLSLKVTTIRLSWLRMQLGGYWQWWEASGSHQSLHREAGSVLYLGGREFRPLWWHASGRYWRRLPEYGISSGAAGFSLRAGLAMRVYRRWHWRLDYSRYRDPGANPPGHGRRQLYLAELQYRL